MQQQNNIKVIISGGGTGGHVFPAIAIANALKEKSANIEILFVGAKDRMEMEKVPAAGYPIEGLWISGLQRRVTVDNLSFPVKLISSVVKAASIIKKFKPDVAVGVGGYASGPLLYAASRKKIPTLIQEQNSYPGITNRLLAGRVDRICVAYAGMEKYFPKEKLILTGNPVRQNVVHLEGKRPRGLEHFNLPDGKKILLVIGGSLGSRTINESIASNLDAFVKAGISLIWQTGKVYYLHAQAAAAAYEKDGIRVLDFINKMDYAYAAADAVISRAGASSVSELSLVKKPAILIPSPNVAEDHQTKNAQALVTHQAAILVKDEEAGSKLAPAAIQLIGDEQMCATLKNNISRMGFSNSADVIASEILNLAGKK